MSSSSLCSADNWPLSDPLAPVSRLGDLDVPASDVLSVRFMCLDLPLPMEGASFADTSLLVCIVFHDTG